jgi:hypothetical protein
LISVSEQSNYAKQKPKIMKTIKKTIGKTRGTRIDIVSSSCYYMVEKINDALDVMESKMVPNIDEKVEPVMLVNSILDSMRNMCDRLVRMSYYCSYNYNKWHVKKMENQAFLGKVTDTYQRIETIRTRKN